VIDLFADVAVTSDDATDASQATRAAIFATDGAGRITSWNRFAHRLLGWSAGDVIGRDAVTVFGVADERGREIARTLASGREWAATTRCARADGSTFPALVTVSGQRGTEGPTGFIGVVVDLTAMREADARLSEQAQRRLEAETSAKTSERLLATIVESAEDAIISTTLDGTVLTWNSAAERIYGYSSAEMVGSSIDRLVPLEKRLAMADRTARFLDGERISQEESVDIGRDGRRIDVSMSAAPIRDGDGEIVAVANVIRDISTTKQARESLRVQARLLDEVPAYVVATDATGVITHWNRFAEDAFGWRRDEAVGRHIMAVIPYSSDELTGIMAAITGGERWSGDVSVPTRDGGTFEAISSVAPLLHDDGSLLGMVETGMDIAERKRSEEAQALLSAVVASVPDALLSTGMDGAVTSWNAGAERLFGYEAAEAVGRRIGELLHDDGERVGDYVARALAGEPVENRTIIAVTKDDRRVELRTAASPITAGGKVVGAACLYHDVTGEVANARERARLASAVEQAHDTVLIADANGTVLYANPAFERVTGLSARAVLGRSIVDVVPLREFVEADRPVPRWDWTSVGSHSAKWSGEHAVRGRYELDLVIWPVRDESDAIRSVVCVGRDRTEERRLERELEDERRVRASVSASLAKLRPLATAEETAAAICAEMAMLPGVDAVAVCEFTSDGVVVLGGVHHDDAWWPSSDRRLGIEIGAAVRDRTAGGPWLDATQRRRRSESVAGAMGLGEVAGIPVSGTGELLGVILVGADAPRGTRLAEQLGMLAEYGSMAGALLSPVLLERKRIGTVRSDIAATISRHAFHPVFQAIVELDTGAVVGYEALTRFDDGTPPDRKFRDATDVGLGPQLEGSCLRASIAAAEALPAEAWLSVNVSPAFLLSGGARTLFAGVDRQVMLEITEHAQVDDYAALRDALAAVEGAVTVAVDDGGAGYASMAHIVELRPRHVKIDRHLISEIHRDVGKQAMLSGMTYYAAQVGVSLIAEGVETAEEREALQRLAIPFAQGWLFAKPLPAGEAAAVAAGSTRSEAPA
jgi:PAS domain S-box-containing protein